jgi:hydroxyethylthiazole kinase
MSIQQQLLDEPTATDLRALVQRSPLTQCLTNIVVTNFTANVLLAIGAAPAMVIAEQEADQFARIADAVLVNVGTVTDGDIGGFRNAAAAASEAGTPWVLDPVAYGALPYRSRIVEELLESSPTVIRGNASEILALAGVQSEVRGPDSTAESVDAVDAAKALAQRTGTVVAVSGVTDYVTNGHDVVAVEGGHAFMPKVTGTGCALGAVIGAFVAVSPNPLQGAVSASTVFGVAGLRAGHRASGPGSFAPAFLDELYLLGHDDES